jgi:hypothetical protein
MGEKIMAIKVVYKSVRSDTSTAWYTEQSGNYVRPNCFDDISDQVNGANPQTFVSIMEPDAATKILTHTWVDLDTYNKTTGDYDQSTKSAWKTWATSLGTYNASNGITRIRYIYDSTNNLDSTQRQVLNVYWEDYSE